MVHLMIDFDLVAIRQGFFTQILPQIGTFLNVDLLISKERVVF